VLVIVLGMSMLLHVLRKRRIKAETVCSSQTHIAVGIAEYKKILSNSICTFSLVYNYFKWYVIPLCLEYRKQIEI
jgi:hypothetical protein